VVPDMEGHVAKGPPRFLWLGARWSDPDERNAVQSNALPDLVSSLRRHAEIFDSYRSAWASLANRTTETVRREIGEELAGEAVGRVMEAVAGQSFLAGLVVKLGKSAVKFAKDRHAGPRAFEEIEERQEESLVDDLVDSFRLMLGSGDSVPVILWLDDAQWADQETREFVAKLWEQATKRRWPLLIVVTHWEREWRQSGHARTNDQPSSALRDFEGERSVAVWHLENATRDALAAYLAQRLPGLTPEQQRLLVEKSGGNFLSMVENVGELAQEPHWFVGGCIGGALTDDAVAYIREFESERGRRVEQRFKALETEVKQMLGWSAEMGSRFLTSTVIEFARARSISARPDETLAVCVDPYALVAKPIPEVGEFRDPAYHRVASAYSARFLQRDRPMFLEFMRRQLVVSLEAVAIDGDLPRAFVFERLGSSHYRERRYLRKRSIASLRLFPASESWRRQPVCLVLTENLRDEIGFAARYLRTVSEGGSASEARTAIAVRCWLLTEGRPQSDGQFESWLAMIESTDWTDEVIASIPANILWLWSQTVPVTPRCAEAMRAAALQKWMSQRDEFGDRGAEAGDVKGLLTELAECSRWDAADPAQSVPEESRKQLAELAIQLAKQAPNEPIAEPLLPQVSLHALVVAESSFGPDQSFRKFSLDELGSMIRLPSASRDKWYDARWAVWLRLCAKRELDTCGGSLRQKVQDAVAAHLAVPSEARDVQDDLDLSSLVRDCRPHFSQLEFLKLEYALAELEGNSLEVSTEVQRAEIAIGLARAFEAACDHETASEWWLKALQNWASAGRQGSRWHSSEILSFNSVSSTLARLMIEDASIRTELKAVAPFIGGVASILDEAIGAAPSDGIELLDFILIETALRAIGETLGRYESRDPAFKTLRNEREIAQLCEELRRRFGSERKTKQ
jgi:hypothetical protein